MSGSTHYILLDKPKLDCQFGAIRVQAIVPVYPSALHSLTSKFYEYGNSFINFLFIFAGMRKAYWITCNVEPDIQHLSLDRRRLPSSFVVRPRDLNRLLANFQTTLQEITIIATEATSLPSNSASEIGGKAVELRSYIDPSKGSLCYYIFLLRC